MNRLVASTQGLLCRTGLANNDAAHEGIASLVDSDCDSLGKVLDCLSSRDQQRLIRILKRSPLTLAERKTLARNLRRYFSEYASLSAAIARWNLRDCHLHLSGSVPYSFIAGNLDRVPGDAWERLEALSGIDFPAIVRGKKYEAFKQVFYSDCSRGTFRSFHLPVLIIHTVLAAAPQKVDRVYCRIGKRNIAQNVHFLRLHVFPRYAPAEDGAIGKDSEAASVAGHIDTVTESLRRLADHHAEFGYEILIHVSKNSSLSQMKSFLKKLQEERTSSPDIFKKLHITGISISGDNHTDVRGGFPSFIAEVKELTGAEKIVCHAGETFSSLEEGIEEVRQAIEVLGATHISHGIAAGYNPYRLLGTTDAYGRTYTRGRADRIYRMQEELLTEIAAKRIVIEVCPSASEYTGAIRHVYEHPFKRFYDHGILLCVGTDAATVFDTDIVREIYTLFKVSGLSLDNMRSVAEGKVQ